jgi:hypothetical protein
MENGERGGQEGREERREERTRSGETTREEETTVSSLLLPCSLAQTIPAPRKTHAARQSTCTRFREVIGRFAQYKPLGVI